MSSNLAKGILAIGRAIKPASLPTVERALIKVTNQVGKFTNQVSKVTNQVSYLPSKEAFIDGLKKGSKFTSEVLMLTGTIEAGVMVKNHNPEAPKNVYITGKQLLCYFFPEVKYGVKSIDNLQVLSQSINKIMSDDKMSDDKNSVEKMSDEKMLDDEKSVDKISDDKKSVDKKSVDKMSDDKKSVDKMSDDKKSVNKMSDEKMSDDKKSVDKKSDEKMSDKEMSDEEIGKALLHTFFNTIVTQLKFSKKPKVVDAILKSKETIEEITKVINSEQNDKDAAKNCIKKLTKLYLPTIGVLIDAITLPERWLDLAYEFGLDKTLKNYSQTDIDTDGQISLGVPSLETNKKIVVDKQDIDSDAAKQAQELISISEPKKKKFDMKEINELCKTFIDDFKQMEVFEVNEEGNIYKLKEMSEDPNLPQTLEVTNKAFLCMLKAVDEYNKNLFRNYIPVSYDNDGHSVWEA